MATIDHLQLATWQATADATPWGLSRYQMPAAVHETLAQWQRPRGAGPAAAPLALKGLPEIFATVVPDAAYMDRAADAPQCGKPLQVFFLGDRVGDRPLQDQVRHALSFWLALHHPDKSGAVRAQLAASATEAANWSAFEVPCQTRRHPGVCAVPVDNRFFAALAVRALRALEGQILHFRSGVQRTLVAHTAQHAPFSGLELVAWPPQRDPAKPDYFWAEVITLATATFPERPGIHLLARPSIRNWGPVRRYAARAERARSMDVFIAAALAPPTAPAYQHSSFLFQPRPTPGAPPTERSLVACWEHKEDERVLDLICRLAGCAPLAPSDAITAISHDQGLMILPRLGAGHGDRYLPGGSGVGWLDRMDIASSLDPLLAAMGLQRVKPLTRVKRALVLAKPFGDMGPRAERRKALAQTLTHLGRTAPHLDVFVFHQLEATPGVISDAITQFLGEPAERVGFWLRWPDEELTIRLIPSVAGPLSEQLPPVELTADEQRGLTSAQIGQLRRLKEQARNQTQQAAMAAHILQVRASTTGIGCAILEMHAALQNHAWTDPYGLAKRELARQHLLGQVVLIADETPVDKYRMAFRDCLRMVGVVPANAVPQHLAPAALTVLQLNEDVVSGTNRASTAFPLAARINQGRLECGVPTPSGDPEWLPYARACLRLAQGDFSPFGRSHDDHTRAKYGAFFAAALEQIANRGPCLVMVEEGSVAHKWPGVQNAHLTFDNLTAGTRTFTPAQAPNLRVIRTSLSAQRLPPHYHEQTNKEVSGFFSWDGAHRTFYGLKVAPRTAQNIKINAVISRHGAGDNKPKDAAVRQLPQLDEICVAFCQPGDDPAALGLLTHRLRQTHVQFSDDTNLPFPLHELRLLGRSVTL